MFAIAVKTVIYVLLGDFEEKQILKKCTRFRTTLKFEKKIKQLESINFLQCCRNCKTGVQRNNLKIEIFSLNVPFFCYIFRVCVISFVFWQKLSIVCQSSNLYVQRERFEENQLSKFVFFYKHFRTLSQKSRPFSETLKLVFHSCSLRVQGNKYRNFQWSKKKLLSVFCLWAEILFFCRNFVGRLAKRAFQLSRSTLREKDVESKSYFLNVK